jgi:uncharacterized SAM-binding protein YcdF (DUF218 family)
LLSAWLSHTFLSVIASFLLLLISAPACVAACLQPACLLLSCSHTAWLSGQQYANWSPYFKVSIDTLLLGGNEIQFYHLTGTSWVRLKYQHAHTNKASDACHKIH